MADMVRQTFEQEKQALRYEYFKGVEPLHYYCLLSFEDKWAFYCTKPPTTTRATTSRGIAMRSSSIWTP